MIKMKNVRLSVAIDVLMFYVSRLGSILIDWTIACFIGVGVYAIVSTVFISYFSTLKQVELILWFIYFQLLCKPLYFILMEYFYSRTIGKKILGLNIVNVRDQKMTLLQVVARYIICSVHYLSYGITLFWPVFNHQRLSLHEQLSKTKVIREIDAIENKIHFEA